jgi:hypothetical protein
VTVGKNRSKGLTVTVHIDGVRETIRAFDLLPTQASDELRDASQRIAQALEGKIRAAAAAEGGQASILAPTVKARRDRVPAVQAGGVKRIGRRRKPAYKLLFGSEFGASQTGRYSLKQFKPHLGSGSYWFFRTVEDDATQIDEQWNKAADDIIRRFGHG